MTINHSELTKLTLIMPTSRRQDYALRNMRYWSNTSVTLIVLDNSPSPIEANLIKSFGKNIIYKYDNRTYEKRIAGAIPLINTTYTQLIADDEFYVKSAVISCIRELDKDNTLTSCTGCCLKFIVDKRSKKIYSKFVYERLYDEYEHSIQEDPSKRLNLYMKNYEPFPVYAVTRSSVWKKAFELINNHKQFNFFSSDEYQLNSYLIFSGKSKVIKELLWLRSAGENIPVRDLKFDLVESPINIVQWWNSNNLEREEFIEKLSKVLRNINLDLNLDYKKIVIDSYNHYKSGGAGWLENKMHYTKEKKGIFVYYLIRFYNLIKMLIPFKIKNIIKSSQLWEINYSSFLEGTDLLSNKSIKVDYENLKNIEQIVLDFHKID